MGPGAWQFVELQAGIEDAQVFGADELHRDMHVGTQGLAQHFIHRHQHRLLARGFGQYLHVQRAIIEGHHKTRAAHAAQLVQH